jgi:2-polyprenyl-3-methyl-5-hydroxy-6-metoxy-1,4-benzoquinol methylase
VDLVERKRSFSARHPWELARADFFLALLQRHDLLDGEADWLDGGAGDAWFARQLRDRLSTDATVTCWDANYTREEIQVLREHDAENLTYVIERPTGRFDRILMLDLLEHVEDDAKFVTAAVDDLLRDDGILLVSVPAYQSLWSSHDDASRHRRRYSPPACRRLLEAAALVVVSSGGLFASLIPVRTGERLIERARPATSAASGIGGWSGGHVLTSALTRTLSADGRLSLALSERGVPLPGLSFWAFCRRSGA